MRQMVKEINSLTSQGFEVDLSWNNFIHITYKHEYLLMYSYFHNPIFTYEDVIKYIVELLSNWYVEYTTTGEFKKIGNIDQMIDRHFKVSNIIA